MSLNSANIEVLPPRRIANSGADTTRSSARKCSRQNGVDQHSEGTPISLQGNTPRHWRTGTSFRSTKPWTSSTTLFRLPYTLTKVISVCSKLRRDKLLVVAGTGIREAYQVPFWKLCQAIWRTSRYWCLGSFDHRLARADDGRRRWQPSHGW